jgi:hypothetical protein
MFHTETVLCGTITSAVDSSLSVKAELCLFQNKMNCFTLKLCFVKHYIVAAILLLSAS